MSEYNPMVLVADVVNLLGAKGVTTLVGANATTAKHAAADLLRALGVVPAPTTVPSSPSSPEVAFGADRHARPDERCDCGRAAVVVYATTGYGDLPWCGRAHR